MCDIIIYSSVEMSNASVSDMNRTFYYSFEFIYIICVDKIDSENNDTLFLMIDIQIECVIIFTEMLFCS